MGFSHHTLVSFLAFLGAAPSTGASPIVSEASSKRNVFTPRQASPGFQCKYPEGWEFCNEKGNRGCWVKDKNGKVFDIDTDYEDNVPEGTTRTYDLDITEAEIAPDGFTKLAQVINGKYPGELIEACWGDTVVVNVRNVNKNNGTTIHWHGLRMLGENQMDGVNGVTQCPIAQDDVFTYRFRLRQYGPTWYHSHYSSQYTDGVAAPFMVHGPSTADWDEEWSPIIVADWYHENAYEAFHNSLPGLPPAADSIVVNGTGRYKDGGAYFQQTFEHDKKYLIRIINGGTDFHFHFSIDNHMLQVVSADMVPIEPFFTNSLSVGIGQRYSVIVHANQTAAANGRYWMRTEYKAGDCQFNHPNFPAAQPDTQRVGIISYADATGDATPTTERWPVTVGCADPVVTPHINWTVTAPQNDILKNAHYAGSDRTGQVHGAFRWELAETPMWLNFTDPTILNLDNKTWNPEYAVEPYNFNEPEGFVYMIINSGNATNRMFSGTHPIHLHGHDFAVISAGSQNFDPANPPKFNLENPPRRDVAMLPNNGHLVLAFKTDNPGVWLVHCHIAWHAGSGLALQVLEKQDKILSSIGGAPSLDPVKQGCNKWSEWMGRPGTWKYADQEDSGI